MIYLFDELVSTGRLRHFPIHLDSPMAVDATRIYAALPEASSASLPDIGGRSLLHGKWVSCTTTRAESEALNKMKGPAVIISSSGMLARRSDPAPLPRAPAAPGEHAADHRLPGGRHARAVRCSTARTSCASTRGTCRCWPRSATSRASPVTRTPGS